MFHLVLYRFPQTDPWITFPWKCDILRAITFTRAVGGTTSPETISDIIFRDNMSS